MDFTSAALGIATSTARSFFSPRFHAAISSSPVRILASRCRASFH